MTYVSSLELVHLILLVFVKAADTVVADAFAMDSLFSAAVLFSS